MAIAAADVLTVLPEAQGFAVGLRYDWLSAKISLMNKSSVLNAYINYLSCYSNSNCGYLVKNLPARDFIR